MKKVIPEHRGLREIKVIPAHRVRKVLPATMVIPPSRVLTTSMVQKVTRATKVIRATRATRVRKGPKVILVIQVLSDRLAQMQRLPERQLP